MIDNHPAIRKRRIHYVNPDSKILETRVAYFEKLLKLLTNVEITEIPNLDANKDCDLLIINAVNIRNDAFVKWMQQIYLKITKETEFKNRTIEKTITASAIEKLVKPVTPSVVEGSQTQFAIPVPTLFFSKLDFPSLNSIWNFAHQENWYFDILNPDHMDSLPIRVANLLRINDHIHEIKRYETELQNIKNKLLNLETKIEKHK